MNLEFLMRTLKLAHRGDDLVRRRKRVCSNLTPTESIGNVLCLHLGLPHLLSFASEVISSYFHDEKRYFIQVNAVQ